MTVIFMFILYIIILSADVGVDKKLLYAVKEYEVVNKDIAYADVSLFIRAELRHFCHMQQRKFNVKMLL